MSPAKKEQFLSYIDEVNAGVIATSDKERGPESAFINLAVMPDLAIVFETLITSRKYCNIQRDPRASLVVGGHGKTTLQIEGLVDEPTDVLLDEMIATYYGACPQNVSHRNWPGVTYLRLRPRWLRFSDYGMPWKVEEHFLNT
jgi:pyridoxine/pyridoxamine 5'-phosphate oxidase